MIKANFIFTFILDLVIVLYILYWLNYLYKIKCKCSLNERREQIIKYWYFILSLLVITLIFVLFTGNSNIVYITIGKNKSYIIAYNIFISFVVLLTVFNSYNTYKYISDINENKCACAISVHSKIIYYYAITALVFSIISFFFMLFIVIFFSLYCDEKCIKDRIKKYQSTYKN
jgi:hypothetical protein